MEHKSKSYKHKSRFSVEDVINSVEQFRKELKYRGKWIWESEKWAEQLGVFTDALDARDDWEIHSELFLVSMWFMLVSITLSFFSLKRMKYGQKNPVI